MNILQNQAWQFIITAFISLIALLVPIYVYYKQRNYKHVLCEILSNAPVVEISKEVKPDIQIYFRGKLVHDLRIILVKLQNTGTSPISSKDFEEPIQFFLGEDADILDVVVVEATPKSLLPKIINNVNFLTIQPLLLNPKDTFVLKVVARKASEKIEIRGRIYGVKDITTALPNRNSSGVTISSFLVIFIFAMIGLGYLFSENYYVRKDLSRHAIVVMTLQAELNDATSVHRSQNQVNTLESEYQTAIIQLHAVMTPQLNSMQTSTPSTTPSP